MLIKSFAEAMRVARTFLVLSLLIAPAGHAVEITLAAARDNTLIESPTGMNSNGIGAVIFAGRVNSSGEPTPRRRAVIGFDIASAIPSGATIESVTLELTRTAGNLSPTILDLHALSSDWGEGTSSASTGNGAASTPGDATWIHGFFDTVSWTPGGDFDPTPSATEFTQNGDAFSWTSPAMISDVQSWLDDPDNEFGWILIGDESVAMTTIQLGSRENGSSLLQPALNVTYAPEPGTTMLGGAALLSLALLTRAGRKSRWEISG